MASWDPSEELPPRPCWRPDCCPSVCSATTTPLCPLRKAGCSRRFQPQHLWRFLVFCVLTVFLWPVFYLKITHLQEQRNIREKPGAFSNGDVAGLARVGRYLPILPLLLSCPPPGHRSPSPSCDRCSICKKLGADILIRTCDWCWALLQSNRVHI